MQQRDDERFWYGADLIAVRDRYADGTPSTSVTLELRIKTDRHMPDEEIASELALIFTSDNLWKLTRKPNKRIRDMMLDQLMRRAR